MTDLKLRGGHRAMATRLLSTIEVLIQSTEFDDNKIRASVKELRRHRDEMLKFDKLIHVTLDEEELLTDMEESSRRILLIEEGLSMAEQNLIRFESLNRSQNINSVHNFSSMPYVGIKLPTLNLPKFQGNPLEWSHFWDIFNNAIHSRTDISDAQKFVYLTGQLQGEAAELLEGFTTTDANYIEAVRLLSETYGDPKRIIQSHLHALFDLCGPGPNAEELSKFRSAFECHLRGLKVLGTKVDDAGFVFSALLLRKLPPRIRDNINRAARSNYWELEDFRKAINDEIILLQAIEPEDQKNKSVTSKSTVSKFNKFNKSYQKGFSKSKSTVSNFSIGIDEKLPKYKVGTLICRLCFENHHLKDCKSYVEPMDKSNRVKELNLCAKCLTNTHITSNCLSQIKCKHCKGNHNSSLCFKILKKAQETSTDERNINIAAAVTCSDRGKSSVALPTAIVRLRGSNKVKSVRALVDQGSQRTFILSSIANELGLKPKGYVNLAIDGFNSEGKVKKYFYVELNILCKESVIPIEAIVVDYLPSRLNMPGIKNTIEKLKTLNVKLADPLIDSDCVTDISLLIGSDYYYDFVQGYRNVSDVKVIYSLLGNMITGKLPIIKKTKTCSSSVVTVLRISEHEEESLNSTLEKFWSLDSIGINPCELSSKETEAYKKFKNSLKFENGHYIASLPWKSDVVKLPNNYYLAKSRLSCVLKQLRNSNLLKTYDSLIKEQLQSGFIEEVNDVEALDAHYLPHFPVLRKSPTTPVRIVYDCSAGKPSLNDCLLTGPTLTNDLCHILLRFRVSKYACISDIEKAFLNIHLNVDDRNFTRFLWPQNPFERESSINIYRFRVVLFGATCSPFLLNASIRHHLENIKSVTAQDIIDGLYVDNLIYTTNDEKSILKFYEDSKSLMSKAGLTLREWVTNFDKLDELIKLNNDGIKTETNDVKVLGMIWDFKSDSLKFSSVKIDSSADTKRKVLQTTASVFDPLGYLLPVTIKARIFMQTLWKLKMEWDKPLTMELQQEWKLLARDITNSLLFRFPRQIITSPPVILHAFADASSKAYGAAIYVVSNNQSNLLLAKAKVAPIRSLTIPKLELTAAVLASRLAVFVSKAFKNLHFSDYHFWSDSKVVLGWLNCNKTLQPYVQNRVDEIKKLFPNHEWHFVPSQNNPSDLLTRGVKSKDLTNSKLWFHGPSWLCNKLHWPVSNGISNDYDNEVLTLTTFIEPPQNSVFFIENISSLDKVIKITALVYRFITKLRNKGNSASSSKGESDYTHNLSTEEIYLAELYWIKFIQTKYFGEEIKFLKKRDFKMPNLVRQLQLFTDEKEILRCRKRLDYSFLEYDVKYPILLPNKHFYTTLLIRDYHHKNNHPGVSQMVSLMRQKYWFSKMRRTIKSTISPCIVCKKVIGTSYKMPPVPPLPEDRLTMSRPFTITGIDYTGALLIKEGKKLKKAYILLFTCACTRAVHLELVDDLTAESFVRALRRFTSRRSTPNCIYSDNAPTFVKTCSLLGNMYKHSVTKSFLSNNRINWKFIPSRAPWYGGFWERLVGLTKNSLKKTLANSLVSRDELATILVEIERSINNRPLTYTSDDPRDLNPLTPADLLYGYQPGEPRVSNLNELCWDVKNRKFFSKRQKYCNQLISHFWKRWKTEYVTSLKDFHYRSKGKIPHLGDIVQIREEIPRSRWRIGRIVSLFKGKDGNVRTAEVQTSTGKSIRPIVKLYPLEIGDTLSNSLSSIPINKETRPMRKAAQVAKEKIALSAFSL